MSLTAIISWCVFGLVIGALARLIMPGRQRLSLLLTMVLGIAGSFAGGAISSVIFRGSGDVVSPAGWGMSLVGAVVVLFAYTRLAKS